jgi:cell surface protein SprA
LIGVRKERSPEQKPHIYDPENFTFSQSYNEVQRHDYEIVDYLDQQTNSTVDYAYSLQPKAVEPFKKSKFVKKSSYWKLLEDFNFNYLPTNINFSTNIIRQNNRQEFRQVEDVQGLGLDPLYRRNFAFNYNYGFNFNLTKALKINYTASSANIVKSYLNADNEPLENFSIWDKYFDVGRANQHTQQFVLNYDLPINKIPFLSFVKANYSYTGDYQWQRTSEALSNIEIDGANYNLGNTIQNASSNTLNSTFSMDTFYKYIGLTKGANKTGPKPVPVAPKPGEKIVNTATKQVVKSNPFRDGLVGFLTCVKNIQLNYTYNSGTVLPGYTRGVGFFGTSKPTLGFIFGSQDDIRYESAKRGWLTNYQEFNQNFTQVKNKVFKATANIDLLPDFKIDLTFDRTYSENFTEQYDVRPSDLQYNPRSPQSTGNFAISTILIKTAFANSDENTSVAFDDLKTNRLEIANRLAADFYGNQAIPRYGSGLYNIPAENATALETDVANPNNPERKIRITNEGYPVGFGKGNQAVVLPAFLAAYSGSSASGASLGLFKNFPLPNWAVKYTGLMRLEFFKENFKRFSLQHNYKASYTVNAFRSNFEYDKNPSVYKDGKLTSVDAGGNAFNQTITSNVNLVEQFSPLLRVDFELKSAVKILAEVKKDRALSMSFDNNLLTEVKGTEYVVGLGYRIKDVIFSSKLSDDPTGIIKSDINIKADFSYRNNKTIVRYLDYDNNQLAAGQNLWSVKLTADYSFSKNLTAIFYYDHSFSNAVISTSFPLTNIRSGFTIRYNFGN